MRPKGTFMRRIQFAAVIALSAAATAGCASEEPPRKEVSGTVQSIGFGGTGNKPVRYFKLEGNTDMYVCFVDDVVNCGALDKGLTVTMRVNENLSIDSLEYTELK